MQVARLRFWDGVGVQQPCSNLSKGSENYRKVTSENTAISRYFAHSRKRQKSINPPLHGGGQGFESPWLH